MRHICSFKNMYYGMALFICALLFVLPAIQMVYPLIDSNELIGVSNEIKRPTFSLVTVFNTTYQDQLTTWTDRNVGFRNEFIRTDNQINWSIFQEVSANRPVRLIRGKDNFLYEKAYIDELNDKYPVPQKIINKKIETISILEQTLKNNNIQFLLIIAPSKASTYPEYIPTTWNKEIVVDNYTRLSNALQQSNISYFDVTNYFSLEKQKGVEQLFPWSGTHWSYYGTCLAMEQFSNLLEGIHHINCSPLVEYEYPIGIDQDLASYLNLWIKPTPPMPIKFPTVSVSGDIDQIVFVGDSFLWNITTLLDRTSLYNKRSVFYYNETLYERTGLDVQSSTTVDELSDEEKKQIILESDIIIIEVSHTAINNIGFGFIEETLELIK